MNSKEVSITYIGNMPSKFTGVKSAMENLVPHLGEFFRIHVASSKKGQVSRLVDMIKTFFIHGLSSDWIIIDVYSTKAFYFAQVIGSLSRAFSKPYILFLHGGNLPEIFEKEPKALVRLFSQATHIVAPSHYLKNFFEGKGFKVSLIPNLIHISEYPFKARDIVSPKILSIRGFNSPYNPLMTVRSIKILRERGYHVELMMLGNREDTYYSDVVNYIRDNDLDDLVTVQRRLLKSEWIRLAAGYDIMVSNPDIDNMPVSLIEGLALGMCVISTEVGGVPFLVENGREVLLVNRNDEVGLADAILRLLKEPALAARLSINGRSKSEAYDWKNVKELWKEILQA